ncbi:diguanylate cyclase [Desulfatiferula olefinivorans]
MNVLIAEDDSTSRMMLAAVLTKWGFQVTAVDNGIAALETLEKPDPPRLVILDWNMPGMTGLEVCKVIRTRYPLAPFYIIILTARVDKTHLIMGLDAGANDYIVKPYDKDEIRARVHVGKRMVTTQQELEAARQALAWEARHDPLTGILNRRAILSELEQHMDRTDHSDETLWAAMFDIDHFKQINDRYGHQAGDDVLRIFTVRIASGLEESHALGRYGGEEFLALIPGKDPDEVLKILDTIRRSIEEPPFDTRMGPIPVTVSIGLAARSADQAMDALLAKADEALYEAKRLGRNRICCA